MPVSAPLVLEGFTPVSESLEWRIGQAYWTARGTAAFLDGSVPHLVTSDGVFAARAADVLFAGCAAAEGKGLLEDTIRVAEVGIGLGLFARLFLDRFRARCVAAGCSYYDRLVYYAGDLSPQMLEDVQRHGTLSEHREQVRLGTLDALHPDRLTPLRGGEPVRLSGLRAVLHTYVLDTLPFDVLIAQDGGWLRLCLRTTLGDAELAAEAAGLETAQLVALAAEGGPAALQRLLPAGDLLDADRAYLPAEVARLPWGEEVAAFAASTGAGGAPLVVSHGALTALAAAAEVLRDDGFILWGDYGTTAADTPAAWADWHQRFGGARGMGINFALVDEVLRSRDLRVVVPEGDDRAAVHMRLVSRRPLAEAERAMADGFSAAALSHADDLLAAARSAAAAGELTAADMAYAEALAAFPESWYLPLEYSHFAAQALANADLATELAERAVEMNPTASALVWTTYGDALYVAGRYPDALAAYARAQALAPADPNPLACTAWALTEMGRYAEAIETLARALALDGSDLHREPLLGKLNEILDRRQAAGARL